MERAIGMVANAVDVAQAVLGIERPRVAILSACRSRSRRGHPRVGSLIRPADVGPTPWSAAPCHSTWPPIRMPWRCRGCRTCPAPRRWRAGRTCWSAPPATRARAVRNAGRLGQVWRGIPGEHHRGISRAVCRLVAFGHAGDAVGVAGDVRRLCPAKTPGLYQNPAEPADNFAAEYGPRRGSARGFFAWRR